MAKLDHIPAVLEQADITAFLKSIGFEGPNDVAKMVTDLSFHTAAKWYRAQPSEMTAVNLLRLVIAAGKEDELSDWLRTQRGERRGAKRGRLRRVSDVDAGRVAGDDER